MKKQFVQVIVFFNASVIIAGLRSPKGGSAKLLDCAKQKRITAIISNIIVNEVLKHQVKTSRNQSQIIDFLEKRFYIMPFRKRLKNNFVFHGQNISSGFS